MKKILITLLVIGFIFVGLGLNSYLRSEQKDESSETWEGTAKYKLMGISMDVTLLLIKKDDKYESGTIYIQEDIAYDIKITSFENNILKFELIYTEYGTEYKIKAALEVTDKQMKGKWEIEDEDISGTMELTKKEKQ